MEETQFASPARGDAAELERQRRLFSIDWSIRAIFDAMPDLVMVLNTHRQIVFGNRAIVELASSLGCDLIGQRPGEFLRCRHAVNASCGCGTAAACRECGAVSTILNALAGEQGTADCRILRESESGPTALDLRVWGTPFRWKGERFALMVAADISHEMRRRLLERIFFHDILNTAGAIDAMAEMLYRGNLSIDSAKGDLREAARTLVEEIVSQRELLAAESSELIVHVAPVEGEDFLRSVAARHRNDPVAQGKRVEIVAEGNPALRTDPALLSRILGNLLKNALEASRAGDTVVLRCYRRQDRVVFSCENPGAIPAAVAAQIFNRSFSTKGEGRGVGTYSVKLLGERYLDGSVSFRSTPEEGTVFTVDLPLEPVKG